MADSSVLASSPLCEKIPIKTSLINRTINLIILLLLISLLAYRLHSFNNNINHGFAWFLAFLCESFFTFDYLLSLSTTWTPVQFKTHPQTLSQRDATELPAVDLFVTTADAVLEPPIVTVNTVLSLMAVDYPAHKLACYVSDDGCSPLILYALIETSKFARLWIPFCKKYEVQVRAPFRYFSGDAAVSPSDDDDGSPGFHQEWIRMKDEYERLRQKIEAAANGTSQIECCGDYAAFANTTKSDHPTIIKVIWEQKERVPEGIPHLIYVSREKRPNCPHHYKAGAINVLTRVSGVMTNAPLMLNVDCDMFVNNPKIILHAMCCFLGLAPQDCAFVQFPQDFYNRLKDDPFATNMDFASQIIGRGMSGIQGPIYIGSGCFHIRKLMYDFSIDNADVHGNEDDGKVLKESFGNSTELLNSVTQILNNINGPAHDLSNVVQVAHQVAHCDYEHGTAWGTKVGWSYGSVTEDILTGMKMHRMGLSSVWCAPDPQGFLGISPTNLPTCLIQRKRWTTGLLQVFFSQNNPFFDVLNAKFGFRQCLAYMWIFNWSLSSILDLCYCLLPAYCIITNSNFLPKAHEPAMIIIVARLLIQNAQILHFYLQGGLSARAWWNSLRMNKINLATSILFGVLSFLLKFMGISEVVFEVTQKDQPESCDDQDSVNSKDHDAYKDVGRFTFDESPVFILGITFLFVHLTALGLSLFGHDHDEVGVGEFLFSVVIVLFFWPFMRGLFRKGKYGISSSIVLKAASLAFIFVHFCSKASASVG